MSWTHLETELRCAELVKANPCARILAGELASRDIPLDRAKALMRQAVRDVGRKLSPTNAMMLSKLPPPAAPATSSLSDGMRRLCGLEPPAQPPPGSTAAAMARMLAKRSVSGMPKA